MGADNVQIKIPFHGSVIFVTDLLKMIHTHTIQTFLMRYLIIMQYNYNNSLQLGANLEIHT